MFSSDFREFIELLVKHNVKYLVVGGYAVGIHGHPRYTGDLDIWIELSENNASRMMAVIADFGFGSLGISKEDFLIHENMIQLGYPPLRIDILNHIDGVVFSDAYINKKSINIEGLDVHFIGFQELILNKKASGRNADLDDLENLT